MQKLFVTKPQEGYELLDSGDGRKLERFGTVILDRPDPQIIWEKHNPTIWKDAKAVFNENWKGRKSVPPEWNASIGGNIFLVKLSTFKHVGVFPEHVENWNTIRTLVKNANRPVSVLNLFGYTGGATVAALQAGASVCHVDASKSTIEWVKKNTQLSGVDKKEVRFILDDAVSFVRREIRRKKTYDLIIMDPPASGRGPKGEIWKIGDDLPVLIQLISAPSSSNWSNFEWIFSGLFSNIICTNS